MAQTTTPTAITPFKYAPFPDPKTHIRLLILEPGSSTSPLQGRLKTVSLSSKAPNPIYDAVSYVWGDPATPCTILLCEEPLARSSLKEESYHPIPITKNLDAVLRRFRCATTERRTLWTDSICIDQQDNAPEKAAQVKLMSSVYTLADKVLIYLGPATESTPEARKWLEKMYDATMETEKDDLKTNLEWLNAAKFPLVGGDKDWKWNSVKDFFAKYEWRRRKWTVQECVLAREPVFHLGEDWVRGWEWMEVVQGMISNRGPGVVDWTNYGRDEDEVSAEEGREMRINLQQGLAQLNSIALSRKELKRSGGERRGGFMGMASRFQKARCTDPRDHVFSLLGLTRDVEDANGALDPDYGAGAEASVLNTCLRYARYFLRKYRSLSVLSRAGLNGQTPMLAPSWVPNWYGGLLDWKFEHAEGLWDPSQRPKGYNVVPGKLLQLIDEDENGVNISNPVLGLKGVVIDIIEDVAGMYLENEPENGIRDKAFEVQQQRKRSEESDALLAKSSTTQKYHAGEDRFDAYWRTLICNVTVDRDPAPDALRQSFENYRKTFRLDQVATQVEKQDARPFQEAFDKSSWLKVFGTTQKKWMGMFPISTRKGDVVAVLYGGMFPFVLRKVVRDGKSKGNYQLVGQCYIHGIMEGQLDLEPFIEEDIFLGGDFETVQPQEEENRLKILRL